VLVDPKAIVLPLMLALFIHDKRKPQTFNLFGFFLGGLLKGNAQHLQIPPCAMAIAFELLLFDMDLG